jgi:hypothetical protein
MLIKYPLRVTSEEENTFYTMDLLWTGSYYNSVKTPDGDLPPTEELFSGGTFYNRGNLFFGLPRLDLSFRFLVTDKRLLPFQDDDGKAGFNPGFGLYHTSGSRFLYGVQSEYGLPARINNVWLRGIPFMESRSPSSRDLKIEPSAKDSNDAYFHLSTPQKAFKGFDAFVSAAMDEQSNPAIGSGIGFHKNGTEMRLDGFYAQKRLEPRNASSWFSQTPSLPERDFNIYALGAIVNSKNLAFAADCAYSQAFAWGRDLYSSAALRLGNKPWRFSLAGDGAGNRFSDRSGSAAGSGFRLAAKGERFWPRSGLLRFQGSLRSPGLEEDFTRGSFSAYFRPSAPNAAARRANPNAIRFSRSSLSLSRDMRKPEKTIDSLDGLLGFNFGIFSSAFLFSLHSFSHLDQYNGPWPLFAYPSFESFDSFKVSGELGWKPVFRFGALDLKTRLGYTERASKDPLWDVSLNASFRPGKWGRIGFRIASTDFPEKWNYTLSWRYNYSDP